MGRFLIFVTIYFEGLLVFNLAGVLHPADPSCGPQQVRRDVAKAADNCTMVLGYILGRPAA